MNKCDYYIIRMMPEVTVRFTFFGRESIKHVDGRVFIYSSREGILAYSRTSVRLRLLKPRPISQFFFFFVTRLLYSDVIV